MARIIFFYDNEWDKQSDIIPSTEHPNFLAENTQLRDFNEPWRSCYGASSGWGQFIITGGVNDIIDFDEGGGELTCSLTAATYTADTLCTEMKTQMEATIGSAHTYTWEYLESGSDVNHFKVTAAGGNVAFPWKTGGHGSDNTGRTVGDTIGFDETADDGAAATHTADYVRIHTSEHLRIPDTGDPIDVLGFFIRGHNISGATRKIQGNATADFSAPTLDQAFGQNDELMGYIFSSVESFDNWRFYVADINNSDGYVEVGRIFLGDGFQPARNFLNKSRVTHVIDQSIVKRSEGGQISTIQLEDYEVWQYRFIVEGSTQKGYFDDMFETVKKSIPLWICEDPDNILTTTYYCQLVDWKWTPLEEVIDRWGLTIQIEELI